MSGASIATNGALNKTGAGIITLSGANLHSGDTTVNQGTLALGNVNAIANSTLDTGASGAQAVTFTAAGTNTYNVGGLKGADDLAIGGNTLSVGANGQSTSYAGDLSGTNGALTKTGAGILTLTGANTFTGATNVTAGTLQLGNALALQNSALTISGTGALAFSPGITPTLGGLNASFDLTLAANVTNFTFNPGSGVTATYSGALGSVTPGMTLTKTGLGTQILAGANTYTGATIVTAGTLSVGSIGNSGVSGNLGAASNAAANLVFDGGTLQYTGATAGTNRNFTINAGKTATFDITTNNLTVSGASTATNGALTKTGAGILTLSGANLHSGNTTVHAGTLKLDISGSISGSPNIIVGDAGSTGTRLDVTTKTGGLTIGLAQTLKGIGTIDGNTLILGTHAPGNSPGLQTFNGNLIYGTGSALSWELTRNVSTDIGAIRGVFFDALDVIGTGVLTVQPGATSNLVFNGAGSTVDWASTFWNSNHSWLVYGDANAPVLSNPIFANINVSADSLGHAFGVGDGSFSWVQSGTDVHLDFTAPSAVPEPATYGLLMALGLMGIGTMSVLRRRWNVRSAAR